LISTLFVEKAAREKVAPPSRFSSTPSKLSPSFSRMMYLVRTSLPS